MKAQLPKIPLVFLGLGLYRAWIEVAYVGTWVPFPTLPLAGQNLFDAAMVLALLACALLHRAIDPLFRKRKLLWLSAVAVATGSLANFIALGAPELAPRIAVPSAVICGVGIAFLILAWSELYACLSPYQVAVYYAASILFGAAVILICRGFIMPYLSIVSALLPLASMACVLSGFKQVPPDHLPVRKKTTAPLPWMPIALMSLYAFAYGLRENELTAVMGPMSSFGVVAASSIVLVGITCFRDRFDLDVMQRVALPAMVCSLVFVSAYNYVGAVFANLCASFSYTAFSILIFCLLCNISRRFGFSAILLFGLERGIRAIFSLLGRLVDNAIIAWCGHSILSDLVMAITIAALIVAFALILWRGPNQRAGWPMPSIGENPSREGVTDNEPSAEEELALTCSIIRRRYDLTPREEDVLLLLVQGKNISEVAETLVIAKGTAKVHVRHIYEKLGVHSRNELKAIADSAKSKQNVGHHR
ncbi:helix-turn-helix transcriptional regulator [Adlercreutzia sp. R21]|uniref:Helix-turn-helix transcriptional regulator n=1 Tax=Adlercreutzia wanghongyangiae TaxID=3111451 RepID=A0ABU6IFM3_9ACTN|nr:helix-turn-helix transcriptional regulator [Adlercreutzia sp. R21]MEC4175244.1 helix-turn-helix transcriptional regulator [Adlercreutzia sp. R7]MEC4184432.1 helix-turn-helix transcriptional regulator [Adlercreutzia sp. R21]